MNLDVIIPLKSDLLTFAIEITIPSIIKNISYNKIYIVTHKSNFKSLISTFDTKIICLDENDIYENLSLENIKKYFENRNANSERAGWYFQQFLKLSISKLNFITDLYLVWDADAVALKPISFLSKDNKIFIETTKEFHQPYFTTLEKIIGLKKQAEFSFIAEHLVFDKKIVEEIITKISNEKNWWFPILDTIDIKNLENSGFSEYELYGNYISKFHNDTFIIRNLKKSRKGVKYLGKKPSLSGLQLFSIAFDYMSFEQWHKKYKPLPLKFVMIFFTLGKGVISKKTIN